MQQAQRNENSNLTAFFEESFRNIEASRLGEAILELCQSVTEPSEPQTDETEVCCD